MDGACSPAMTTPLPWTTASGPANLCPVSGRSPPLNPLPILSPVHPTVSDVDARLVVGEQWLLDPEHVTATDEALGGGAHGVVRKGLLYGHVPVALKVRVFRCGLHVVVGVWLWTLRGRLGWEGTGGRAAGAGGVAPLFWPWPSLAC